MNSFKNNNKKLSFNGIKFIRIKNLEDYNNLEKDLYKLEEKNRCQLMIDVENEIIEAECDKEYFAAITIPIITILVSVLLSCLVSVYINGSEPVTKILASYYVICFFTMVVSLILLFVIKGCMKKKMDKITFYTTVKRILEHRYKNLEHTDKREISYMNAEVKEDSFKMKSKIREILFILSFSISPTYAREKYGLTSDMTKGIFALMSSLIMQGIGYILKIVGVIGFCVCWNDRVLGNMNVITYIISVVLVLIFLVFGSMFVTSGEEIIKEEDSSKIMAYTSGILAFVSIIISIILNN